MNRILPRMNAVITSCVALAVICFTQTASAQFPFDSLFPFSKVDADPGKDYKLTEDDGPWLILACTFRGAGAESQAKQLVYELRKNSQLEAYTLYRSYDFTGTVYGRGVDQNAAPVKMKYANERRFNEIAVLVGNFEEIGSSDAQETLKVLKHLHPQCLQVNKGGSTSQVYAFFREVQRRINLTPGKHERGPMGKAFFTRNPLLPASYFEQQGVDPFIQQLNEDVQFSLLDCPGRFTVRVAKFTGNVSYNIQKGFNAEQKLSNKLVVAAENAHKLTMALRAQNIEAYEFHDRTSSIVTVGAFKNVGTRQFNGKLQLDPRIQGIINAYKAQRQFAPGATQVSVKPKRLAGIPFDVTPEPIPVPGKSVSSSFARSR